MLPPEQEPPTTESAPASGNTQSTNITTPASGNEGIKIACVYQLSHYNTTNFYKQ